MSKQSGESIDYLLLHCEVARELFVSIFRLFGFEWVVSQQVVEMSACLETLWEAQETLKFGGWFLCA